MTDQLSKLREAWIAWQPWSPLRIFMHGQPNAIIEIQINGTSSLGADLSQALNVAEAALLERMHKDIDKCARELVDLQSRAARAKEILGK